MREHILAFQREIVVAFTRGDELAAGTARHQRTG
jgi:hypothetical protein